MPTAPMVVSDAWRLIHDWLDRHSPTLRRKLRAPATDKAIAQLEKTVGVSLPDDFKASYRIHDGTESWPGAIIGAPMLSVEAIAETWKELKGLAKDWEQSLPIHVSYEKDRIKEDAVNPHWIPFLGPDEDNYIGIDFDPGPAGTKGQVINFGADQFVYGSNRFVIAESFGGFISFIARLFAEGKVVADPDEPGRLLLAQRRPDGKGYNLFTGLPVLLGVET
jgi:cell wall assembly regulator SMI1